MGRKDRFEKSLAKGSELLEQDKAAEAREAFLSALKARPGDAEALSCLGLSHLRLAQFNDARSVYQKLVDARPEDAAHRRNLGLVQLKLGQFEDAQHQLERSKSAGASDNRGLGYWDGGDGFFERAYKAFVGVAGPTLGQENLFTPDECEAMFEDSWALQEIEGTDASQAMPVAPKRPSALGQPVAVAKTGLMTLANSKTLLVRAGAGGLLRAGDLLAVAGSVRFDAVYERKRGMTTEDRFGGARPFCLVEGAGFVVHSAGSGSFVLLTLEDEALYVREDQVVAFEASLRWENGRIPRDPQETPVVQFRGSGLMALRFEEEPLAVEVLESRSLAVGGDRLLAWTGDVVPRPHPAEAGDVALLSCMGQGKVFLAAA